MTLHQTKGFKPLCLMIFLNAFIDLGHKITIQNIIFKLYDGSEQIILTAIVNALILLPYVFFFAPAGYISDRFSKTIVLRFTASSVLLITSGIAICYYLGLFWPAFFLTFILAIQSAFYAPAKLGLIRELVNNKLLSKANGISQALTTLGILLGTLCFSILFEQRFDSSMTSANQIISNMTLLALCLIALSVIEAGLSFTVVKTTVNTGKLRNVAVKKLFKQNTLFAPVIGLTAFWCIGQMLLATYPAFAKETMGITNTVVIQAILALIAIGVMAGSFLAGILSSEYIQQRLILVAGIIIIACLLLLPITQQIYLAASLFFVTGFAGGLFIVPLLATFQFSSEPSELGQNLANNNLVQNIAMTSCLIITALFAWLDMNSKNILLLNIAIAIVAVSLIHQSMPHILKEFKMATTGSIHLINDDLLNGYDHLLIESDRDIHTLLQKILPNNVECTSPLHYEHKSHFGAKRRKLFANIEQQHDKITIIFTEE